MVSENIYSYCCPLKERSCVNLNWNFQSGDKEMGLLPKTVCMGQLFFHFLGKQNNLLEIMTGSEMHIKINNELVFICLH